MGKKGGETKTTTEVKLPPEIAAAAKKNIQIADQVAAVGAMPYRGPTVAGLSPQQIAAMQSSEQAAQAFGMPNALGPSGGASMSGAELYKALTGMPPPQQFAGGFSGYSSAPLFDQQVAALPPAQRAMLESLVMNPITGASPTNKAIPGINNPFAQPTSTTAAPKPLSWIDKMLQWREEEDRRYGGYSKHLNK